MPFETGNLILAKATGRVCLVLDMELTVRDVRTLWVGTLVDPENWEVI